METTVIVTFKDGRQVSCKPKITSIGIWHLTDDLYLLVNQTALYKQVGNVMCGEDITSQVARLRIFMDN